MALTVRILCYPLLAAGIGAGLGNVFFGSYPDGNGISLVLACVGAIVGAIVGATREIVLALRQNIPTEQADLESHQR